MGYYGNRGDKTLDEESKSGNGFLSSICQTWEQHTLPATKANIRVVNLRFGMVLTPAGGALGKMLLPFRFGLGGKLGKGEHFMSWIALEDALGVMGHALGTPALQGPLNTASPYPITNQDFTKILGKALRRPTPFPMPAFGIQILFGEMGQELLLSSQRLNAQKLLDSGYQFRHPTLEKALSHILRKK